MDFLHYYSALSDVDGSDCPVLGEIDASRVCRRSIGPACEQVHVVVVSRRDRYKEAIIRCDIVPTCCDGER